MAGETGFWNFDINGVLTGIGIVVAVLFGAQQFFASISRDNRKQLDSDSGRSECRNELRASSSYLHHRWRLKKANRRIAGLFGSSWSFQAFEKCLTFAFLYPVFLFIISWIAGNNGMLGDYMLLPPNQTLIDRMLIAFLLLVQFLASAFLLSKTVWLRSKIKSGLIMLVQKFHPKSNTDPLDAAFDFVASAIALVGAVVVVLALAMFGAGDFAGAVTFAIALAVAASITFTGAFIATVSVTGVVTVALLVGPINLELPTLYILFFIALPILNSVLDWASWAFTRLFLERASNLKASPARIPLLIVDILADLVLAVLCLIGLSALLPIAVELINMLLQQFGNTPIDWRAILATAQEKPFTEGLMITGMLATTLLPTAIHLSIGLWSVFVAANPASRRMAGLIPTGHTGLTWTNLADADFRAGKNNGITNAQAAQITRHLTWRWFGKLFAFFLSFALLAVFVYGLFSYAGSFGAGLVDIAYYAGSLVNNAR